MTNDCFLPLEDYIVPSHNMKANSEKEAFQVKIGSMLDLLSHVSSVVWMYLKQFLNIQIQKTEFSGKKNPRIKTLISKLTTFKQ